MQTTNTLQNVRFNFTVNVLDGTFFGLGFGFASTAAVIPLFVATLTDNLALIGLVAALHAIGAFPQIFTAQHVAKLRRYKPFVLLMTLQERLPFFALALVAWLTPQMDKNLALWLVVLLLTWQSFGGGLTGTAWQSMIGKIMPANRRGTFWGAQAAGANLFLSGGAIAAGLILERFGSPFDFTLCFLLTACAMTVSFGFLAATREPETKIVSAEDQPKTSWRSFIDILNKDANFRWFLLARCLAQVTVTAVSFYTIYASRNLGMDEQTAGAMVGVMGLSQTVGNLLLGWAGDKWGHRKIFVLGAGLMTASAVVAMFAPDQSWFYVAFALAGVANVTLWANAMAITVDFGSEAEKPLYIGVSNTLVALPAFAAPLIGGWLAEAVSFQATFLISVVSGLMMAYVLFFVVRDVHARVPAVIEQANPVADARM